MEDSNSRERIATGFSDLVTALNELRDTLLKASLVMRDLQFESDSALRKEAAERSSELIKKAKALR